MKKPHAFRFFVPLAFLFAAAVSVYGQSFKQEATITDIFVVGGFLVAGLIFSFDLWRRSSKQSRRGKDLTRKNEW